MKRHGKRLLKDGRGQSMVEMALVLPMLLVTMLMITEFGRALFYYNVLAQATREGARAAVVASSGNAVAIGRQRMQTFMTQSRVGVADVTWDVQVVGNFNGSGQTVVRATASRPFNWVFRNPMPSNADGSSTVTPAAFTLRAETVMRAEF